MSSAGTKTPPKCSSRSSAVAKVCPHEQVTGETSGHSRPARSVTSAKVARGLPLTWIHRFSWMHRRRGQQQLRPYRPQPRTLKTLLNLYQVSDAVRTDLLDLARNADAQGWLRAYQAELPEEYAAYISFEYEARSVRNYESLYIPGLLQTEDYARAVIRGTLPTATPR
jgi:hypothetical protein